jgi:tripeptidyl-peptidase-1
MLSGLGLALASERTVLFVKHAPGTADKLRAELAERADPSSAAYGSWLSKDEVEQLLRPDPAHLAAAAALAERHGAAPRDVFVVGSDKLVVDFPNGGTPAAFLGAARAAPALDCVTTAAAAAASAASRGGGRIDVSMEPAALATGAARRAARAAVAAAAAITGASSGSTRTAMGSGPQACLSSMNGVTPTCIRAAYGLNNATAALAGDGGRGGPQGQAFIVNQGFGAADLAKFQSTFKLPPQPVAHVVGPNDKAGDEANLDSQYITALGRGVGTTFVYLDGSAENPFTNWLVWAANASDATLPRVHSLSLGAAENEVGDAIMGRMNTEMAALGARGVSVVFASGDSGFQPQQKFGAASPFVTAVGGVFNGEMRSGYLQADSLSTGGFAASAQNKAGAWQKAAIASYLNTSGTRPAKINPAQRAVPDVSA